MKPKKESYKSYSEKLRDPRWQKRRLEFLEKSRWTCRKCHVSTKELHVHHRVYRKGYQPWEYEDTDMSVLCTDCHTRVEDAREQCYVLLSNYAEVFDEVGAYLEISGYLKAMVKAPDMATPEGAHFNRGALAAMLSMAAQGSSDYITSGLDVEE
jgi:hypothetical protein